MTGCSLIWLLGGQAPHLFSFKVIGVQSFSSKMQQTTDGSLSMRIGTLALPVGEDEETAESQQRASLVRQRCYIGGTKFCKMHQMQFLLWVVLCLHNSNWADLCQSLFRASNCSRAALALASFEFSLEDADIKLIHLLIIVMVIAPPPPCFSSSYLKRVVDGPCQISAIFSDQASWLQEAFWSSREVWELPSFPSMWCAMFFLDRRVGVATLRRIYRAGSH